MSVWALVVAAGRGERMGAGRNKALLPLWGKSLLERSVGAFDGLVDGALVVAGEADLEAVRALLGSVPVVCGGDTRQRSVLRGLEALPEDADIVLVHDAARPFLPQEVIRRCIESARTYGSGVASVPVKDTIKRAGSDGMVLETPPRETLYAAQTPQAFGVRALRKAIEALEARGITASDDAGAMESSGFPVRLVEGAYRNIKLTTPEDAAMAEGFLRQGQAPRIGHGIDVHRLAEGRKLILCGVEIPYEKGLLGHSDADVALHALMDALLGAAALGDIGRHFPDTDARYKGISSLELLKHVMALLDAKGLAVGNVDITILCERPKLKPHIEQMRAMVAMALRAAQDAVSIKATTTERLSYEGEGLGITAHAVALLLNNPAESCAK